MANKKENPSDKRARGRPSYATAEQIGAAPESRKERKQYFDTLAHKRRYEKVKEARKIQAQRDLQRHILRGREIQNVTALEHDFVREATDNEREKIIDTERPTIQEAHIFRQFLSLLDQIPKQAITSKEDVPDSGENSVPGFLDDLTTPENGEIEHTYSYNIGENEDNNFMFPSSDSEDGESLPNDRRGSRKSQIGDTTRPERIDTSGSEDNNEGDNSL